MHKNPAQNHKERRRALKLEAKRRKNERHALQQKKSSPSDSLGSSGTYPKFEQDVSKKRNRMQMKAHSGSVDKQNTSRKKVWDTATIDPMIAAEEAEIRRLERLLGIKGGDPKKKMKLNRELAQLDGLGDDFGEFIDKLDNLLKPVKITSHEHISPHSDDDTSNNSFKESDSDTDASSHPFNNLPTDSEGSDDEQFDSPSQDSDDNFVEDSKIQENLHNTYQPVTGQDIYGRSIEKVGESDVKENKYIPPHLRSAKCMKNTDHMQRLFRIVNGHLNRMAEENIEPVVRSLTDVYRNNSTGEVNEVLADAICSVCVHDSQVMNTLVPSYTALLAALNITVGKEIGAYMLEYLANKLNPLLIESKSSHSHDLSEQKNDNKEANSSRRAKCSNYVLLFSYLYVFGVVYCGLMYDLIRMIIENFGELEVELLLLILQNCGFQLRSDDSSSLREVVLLVHKKSADVIAAKTGEEGSGEHSFRVKFMLDTISDLKNNKRKPLSAHGDRTQRLRRYLGTVKSAKGGVGSETFLRISWSDLTSGVKTRGRWWLVGSAWTGIDDNIQIVKTTVKSDSQEDKVEEFGFNSDMSRLTELATHQRMNTSVRKAIFCSVMGASDFEDAFEKLTRLDLSGQQDREIVRVIIDCCGQEKAYNPYYALLASRFCEFESKYRFTFQLAFWDIFKQFNETNSRRAANLARLLAYLTLHKNLSIGIVKTIEISTLASSGVLFLKVLFHTIFSEPDENTALSVFQRIANGGTSQDRSLTCGTVAVLVQKFTGPPSESWPKELKKAHRKRLKKAIQLLDSLPTFDESPDPAEF